MKSKWLSLTRKQERLKGCNPMTNKTDRLLTEREREATAAYEIGFKDGQKIGRAASDKEWQEKIKSLWDLCEKNNLAFTDNGHWNCCEGCRDIAMSFGYMIQEAL
jgi:hypothetical protein